MFWTERSIDWPEVDNLSSSQTSLAQEGIRWFPKKNCPFRVWSYQLKRLTKRSRVGLKTIMKKLPFVRIDSTMAQEVGQEMLIYDFVTFKAHCLDQTTTLVYKACSEQISLDELKLRSQLREEVIFLALEELRKERLLEEGPELDSAFAGVTRREVLKAAGFLVALPAIASVVVPSPAAASSTKPNLAPCGVNSECLSRNCAANASGGRFCCVAGVGIPSGVGPGSGTCTPLANCDLYNATRCCTQGGAVPGAFMCPPGFIACLCT